MAKLYLIGGFVIALLLPHLSSDDISVLDQLLLQVLFILAGLAGFNTFKD